jgi:tetratricopeptide (TPR) repeat protein
MIASDLNLLGTILRAKGELEDAEKLHRESLAMRLKLFGPKNEMVGVSRLMLGVCLSKMERFEEAESEMLEAIRVMEAYMGNKARVIDAYQRMADFYASWGKVEEETRYRNLLKPKVNDP